MNENSGEIKVADSNLINSRQFQLNDGAFFPNPAKNISFKSSKTVSHDEMSDKVNPYSGFNSME